MYLSGWAAQKFCHSELDSESIHANYPLREELTLIDSVSEYGMTIKKAGFTLAEVLITLGIIGVVAAITIPGLMNNYKAKRLRTQFLKTYSVVQQAFKQMEADDLSLDPSTYDRSANPFYLTFKNYFRGITICNMSKLTTPCYNYRVIHSLTYKNLTGSAEIVPFYFDDYQFILPDGTFINVDSPSRSGWIWVMADLNGAQNPPNQMGYDLFVFEFKDGELRTMGSNETMYSDLDKYCSLTSSEALNGIACAHKAKTDTDYFKWVIKNVK